MFFKANKYLGCKRIFKEPLISKLIVFYNQYDSLWFFSGVFIVLRVQNSQCTFPFERIVVQYNPCHQNAFVNAICFTSSTEKNICIASLAPWVEQKWIFFVSSFSPIWLFNNFDCLSYFPMFHPPIVAKVFWNCYLYGWTLQSI